MVDTICFSFSEKKCSDCGKIGCCFTYSGPLVPNGECASFCWFCWGLRLMSNKGKPLGIKPPGEKEEFKNHCLRITTRNNFIYRLEKPNKEGLRRISCSDDVLGFGLCKILLLEMNEPFSIWEYNIENTAKGRQTSPVVKIEKF